MEWHALAVRSPVLIVVLGSLAGCDGRDAPLAPPLHDAVATSGEGRIAFVNNVGGHTDIYVMNADSSGVTRLTDDAAPDLDPAWSPDGSRIAFASSGRDGANSHIYVMNADGSGVTRLTNSPSGQDYFPAWCGTRIAFQSDRFVGGFPDIWVMNDDGTDQTRLTTADRNANPTWSPGCDKIAFSKRPEGSTSAIYVMNPDGLDVHRLLGGPGSHSHPAWSPDGTRIAFASSLDAGSSIEIYLINVDGTQPTRVTADTFYHQYGFPAWSPDAAQIAFQSYGINTAAPPRGIYVINADGSGKSLLAANVDPNGLAWFGPGALPPPPPPPPNGWPNEPAGFSVLTDQPFNALTDFGWYSVQRQTTNGSGLALGADPAAPRSPTSVLQFTYAAGYEGGDAPGVEFFVPPAPVRETYFAFWWKPSNPWQDHPTQVNTIAHLFPETSGVLYIILDGSNQTLAVVPGFVTDTRNLTPNVTATPITFGDWHLIEWYVKYSSGAISHDGVTRWWVDGTLQGDYRDLQMPEDAGFVEYDIAPMWGGTGGTKTETDFFWFDHARISVP